jgi:NTE family protein
VQAERLKIGLALSGGGARGATHVGVLRELERQHIPIDYIAGTSMGAIVGGLYASGMAPDDIEKVLLTTDWDAIFSDRPDRKDLDYRRKEDDRRYIEALQSGLKRHGLEVNKGLVNGQKLMFLLETLLQPVADVEDFDNLPIPFRCPGTDIVTGDEVVFSRGHLPLAIRISMSLPAAFTPVSYEGRLLVDGGVVDNLPVDLCKSMGADIVIAVDIGTPPKTVEGITSPIAVTSQVISILQQKGIDAQAARADILIRPDLAGFSVMDFVHAGSLVPLGEKVMREKSDALSKFALPEADYAARLERIRHREERAEIVRFVRFEGVGPKLEQGLRMRIRTAPGKPLDLDKLQADLTTVYNSGFFESVTYQVVTEDGQRGVLIKAKPNPLAPVFIGFGFKLSSDFRRQSDWAVLAGLRWTGLNVLGGEWKTDLQIGLNRYLNTEFYQPLDVGARWFVAPVFAARNTVSYLYAGDQAVATYRSAIQSIGVNLGYHLGRYGEIRVGPRWGHASFNKDMGSDLFPDSKVSEGGWVVQATVDQLDNADLPNQGYLIKANGMFTTKGMGSDLAYDLGELRWSGFGTKGSNTYWGALAAGSAFGTQAPPYAWFRLGGFNSFGGYQEGQIIGRYYATARLGYQRKVTRLPAFVGQGVYLVFFADVGNAWVDMKDFGNNLKYSGTVAFATLTKFGPMYIGYSKAGGGFDQITLQVGKRF